MATVLIATLTTQSSGTSGAGAESVNPDKYVGPLLDLYPRGPLWSRELDTNLAKFNRVIGTELSRTEHRGEQLLRELDPRTAIELLPEWEEMLDLPDTDGAATDLASRQAACWEKLASEGGISPDFLIEAAARLGYEIEVEQAFRTHGLKCGSGGGCGEGYMCMGAGGPGFVVIHTRAGGNDAQLESALRRFFHQHGQMAVVYDLP